MEGFGFDALWIILGGCVVIALGLGFLAGFYLGGDKDKAVKEAQQAHDDYREDVHEHFEQTSQIMSRMVEDYRQMYEHMSEGADKLADMHQERVITPPPAPEAITAQDRDEEPAPASAESTADEPVDEQAEAQVRAVATAQPTDGGDEPEQSAETDDDTQTPEQADAPTEAAEEQRQPAEEIDTAQQSEQGETPEASAQTDAHESAVEGEAGAGDSAGQASSDEETDKQRARRLSGEAPERGEKTGGI